MKLKIIRIYTGEDNESHFDEVEMGLEQKTPIHFFSHMISNTGVDIHETSPGGSFEWHNAPRRQYVVTLAGKLEFENRKGEKQIINPGDILLAEDVKGGGHKWRLLNDQPWRRIYIHLED